MYISFEYYRIFYYVAKYGSISQAAEALMNNQPNISRTIKNLESELNCTLFVRSRKGVELTPEGEKLYSHVAAAVEQIQYGEEELCLERTLAKGVVTIGASEIALRCYLLPVLKNFRQKYPGVRIRVFNHSTPQAISALKHGLVDLGVVTTPTEDTDLIVSKEICEIREIPVCGAAFPELAGRQVSLSELTKYPMISLFKQTKTYEIYSEWFRKNGCTLSPDIEAATADLILPMVRNNLGIGFVPAQFLECYPTDGLILLDLKESVPTRKICLLKRKSVVTFFFAVDCHAGTSGSQMGMIIRSKEQIKHTVFFCCDSKKSTHFRLLLSYHSVTIQSHVNIKRSPMNEVLNSFRFHKLLQQKTFIR